ncbi:MAG: hypothetical protein NBV67_01050 [Tagaea sp.]|nr:hypothetical protein [Tagaea sp.]
MREQQKGDRDDRRRQAVIQVSPGRPEMLVNQRDDKRRIDDREAWRKPSDADARIRQRQGGQRRDRVARDDVRLRQVGVEQREVSDRTGMQIDHQDQEHDDAKPRGALFAAPFEFVGR